MFRNLTTILAAVTLVAVVGCKKEKEADKEPKADPNAKVDPAPDKKTPEKTAKQNPAMLNDMKNCPSAVKGSTTEISKTDKDVVVSVTGTDEATITEVRKRAAHLVKASAAEAAGKHTGEGTGGGLGKCPVILAGTKIAAADSDKGVKVTITPSDVSKLAGVHTMAAERAASMNKRGGVAHGTGAGMKSGTGEGGQHNMKHSGKRTGEHGSGTGGGGSKGATNKDGKGTAKGANPCADKAANPCAGKAANPCAGKAANPCGGI